MRCEGAEPASQGYRSAGVRRMREGGRWTTGHRAAGTTRPGAQGRNVSPVFAVRLEQMEGRVTGTDGGTG